MEAPLSPSLPSPGDETVRLAISPSTPTTVPPVKRSSSLGETGLAGIWYSSPSSTSMVRVCSSGYRGNSHGTFGGRIGRIIFTAPSEVGLVLRDGGFKTFEIFLPLLHLLLYPPLGRWVGLVFASPLEVLQLPPKPSLEPLNMVQ